MAIALVPLGAGANVFHGLDEIHDLAFPGASRVQGHDYFLDPSQQAAIERRTGIPIDSRLVTVYVGYLGDQVQGYAILDTHLVRTFPETFLVVLHADGSVRSTYVMAFHEPLEYLPHEGWLRGLNGRRLDDDLRIGRAVAGITGATLSSHAVLTGLRRALAIYETLIAEN
ncbi:MAG: FMN-binding protein [Candidatus Binatia bacterium]